MKTYRVTIHAKRQGRSYRGVVRAYTKRSATGKFLRVLRQKGYV